MALDSLNSDEKSFTRTNPLRLGIS